MAVLCTYGRIFIKKDKDSSIITFIEIHTFDMLVSAEFDAVLDGFDIETSPIFQNTAQGFRVSDHRSRCLSLGMNYVLVFIRMQLFMAIK